jgi:hypothetical protein
MVPLTVLVVNGTAPVTTDLTAAGRFPKVIKPNAPTLAISTEAREGYAPERGGEIPHCAFQFERGI